jgi:uncharacterized protein (TIGR00251 family)
LSSPSCFRLSPSGLSLFVRVTPNAGRDAIEGVEIRDDGSAVLRIRVKAVPDKGKANAAVVALLAKVLGVAKSSLSVTNGETGRFKTITVVGDGAELAAVIEKEYPHPTSP